jgi:hypothetical protein
VIIGLTLAVLVALLIMSPPGTLEQSIPAA